jgi:hypothetical protein
MSSRRTTAVWIACFAVLFSLLVMPLSPMPSQASGERVLWGSFCTGSGTRQVAIVLEGVDQAPSNRDEHAAMQHCGCCSGHVVVILPSGLNGGLFVQVEPERFAPQRFLLFNPPRLHWPSINPRASPNA